MRRHTSLRRRKSIIKQYHQGESPKTLCEYYSIPKSILYTWIYQSGIGKRKPRPVLIPKAYKDLQKHSAKMEHECEMLKSFLDYAKTSRKQRFKYMDIIHGQYSIHELCDAFKIDRGTYYNHLRSKDKLTKYDQRRAFLSEQIRNIYEESRHTYGAGRIRLALKRQGIKVSKNYILDLMHENGIIQYKHGSKKSQRISMWRTRKENLFLKGYEAKGVNQIWVSDITTTRLDGRDYNICIYLDIYSRMIVSYSIGRNASTHLVKMALIRAYNTRKPEPGLIIHTDGGAQYDSRTMRIEYKKRRIRHSISRSGTPTDNAFLESFNSTLKDEFLNCHFFRGERELYVKLADFIDFYNTKRIHKALGGLSPQEHEQKVVPVKSTE